MATTETDAKKHHLHLKLPASVSREKLQRINVLHRKKNDTTSATSSASKPPPAPVKINPNDLADAHVCNLLNYIYSGLTLSRMFYFLIEIYPAFVF